MRRLGSFHRSGCCPRLLSLPVLVCPALEGAGLLVEDDTGVTAQLPPSSLPPMPREDETAARSRASSSSAAVALEWEFAILVRRLLMVSSSMGLGSMTWSSR